jgi:hypothetical protein
MGIMITNFPGFYKNIHHQPILIQEVIRRVQFPTLYQVVGKMIAHIIQTPFPPENGEPYPGQFIMIVLFGYCQSLLFQVSM